MKTKYFICVALLISFFSTSVIRSRVIDRAEVYEFLSTGRDVGAAIAPPEVLDTFWERIQHSFEFAHDLWTTLHEFVEAAHPY